MKIDHVISALDRRSGGPSRSVPRLAAAVADEGHEVRLLTVQRPETEIDAESRPGNVEIVGCAPSFPRALWASRELKRLIAASRDTAVFHGHGVWELPVHYAASHCRRRGIPYVMDPHGMLEPWALEWSRTKKRVAAVLFQDRDLRGASCMRALNEGEVQSFRQYGLKGPVAVVPNGVDPAQWEGLDASRGDFLRVCPAAADRPTALFMARIHPKKGLMPLMEAWAQVVRERPDWLLVVAGPDQLGHRAEVEQRVRDLDLAEHVVFVGPLYGGPKRGALAAAEFFVLPSFSEGFSVAILEALVCRLPVVITPGCLFPEVATSGAGFICEPEVPEIRAALLRAIDAGQAGRREIGARGRALIESRYTWKRVGGLMSAVYLWLAGGGARPDCMR